MSDLGRPRLTVLVITYNHAMYIRQAIESVLMQTLSEPYQVIVSDDGSTDNTRSIIDEIFAERPAAPSLHYLDHSVNRGVTQNYRRSFEACDTRYVAVIEGDDYWIYPGKLAAQMAFLDEHWECGAISANYFVYDEKAASYTARVPIESKISYLDARSLIDDNIIGNFSTCMYRLTALKAIPASLYHAIAYDWGVNLCIARNVLIGFMHRPFSVYRVHDGGTWNGLPVQDRIATQLKVIEQYNKATDFVFDNEFEVLANRLTRALAQAGGQKTSSSRTLAIAVACLPPGLILIGRWLGNMTMRFLIPPIIPIAIRKIRSIRS